jgi:hypothetical protein
MNLNHIQKSSEIIVHHFNSHDGHIYWQRFGVSCIVTFSVLFRSTVRNRNHKKWRSSIVICIRF